MLLALDHAADDEAISKREAVLQRNKGSPERLVKWAAEPPDDETSEAPVTIGPSTIGAGNGLFVTRSLKRNEHIMTIPHDKIISVENAWEDESLGPEFRYLTDVGGPGAKLATLAGFVAKEACGQIDGIFELNDDSDRTSSYWQEYLDCLPWRDDHPLWWSDEETNRLLKGSVIEEEVRSTRIQVSNAIENVKALFWNHWISDKAEADDSYMEAGETEAAEIAVRSAFCMLLSRAFEDQETDCMKLVPLLDMTQHSDEGDENISHSTHPTTGNIRVTAKRDLDAGEELFTCYSTTLSPAQFLPAFAFVPNQMGVSGRQLLGHKDPIFFPVEKGNR
ncbi:MAG: hypothetical protein SGBAC_006616 [Bacillariaceae sp.]